MEQDKNNRSCEYICPLPIQRNINVSNNCYQPDLLLGKIHKWTYLGWLSLYSKVLCKAETILKSILNLFSSPSPSLIIQIMDGKVCLRCEGKALLGVVNKLLKKRSLFCLYTSSKLSRPDFGFLLKVNVMGSNAGYLPK